MSHKCRAHARTVLVCGDIVATKLRVVKAVGHSFGECLVIKRLTLGVESEAFVTVYQKLEI